MVDSLRLTLRVPGSDAIKHLYVEKGADTPSDRGTHLDDVTDGYRWIGKSSTYAHPISGQQREIIPAEIIYRSGTRASEPGSQAGWYAGIEFSGRTRITLERAGAMLKSVLGLNPDLGAFRTRLQPNESFDSPTIFLGAFTGTVDDAGNQLRHWVRSTLTHAKTWQDPQYPLMVNDSWGSGTQVDEPLALRMIANSKDLGLEMFQLDAGWFRGVGDWYPDARKFPHGLATLAEAAHRSGLRFGLWVDWAQAELSARNWFFLGLPGTKIRRGVAFSELMGSISFDGSDRATGTHRAVPDYLYGEQRSPIVGSDPAVLRCHERDKRIVDDRMQESAGGLEQRVLLNVRPRNA